MAEFSKKFFRGTAAKHTYSSGKQSGGMLWLIILLFIPVFFYVWLQMKSVKMNYDINEITVEKEKLLSENRHLERRIQMLVSGEMIERVAVEKYGFRRAGSGDIYVIKKEKSLFERIKGLVSRG
ncbi:MAG TPA: hypothetical protein ENN55_03130 [Firmicutes bacterium]|nr:hypothetical protein [Bacillota bacterium]